MSIGAGGRVHDPAGRRRRLLATLLAACAVLAAPTSASAQQVDPRPTLSFGDSITAGTRAEPGCNPQLLDLACQHLSWATGQDARVSSVCSRLPRALSRLDCDGQPLAQFDDMTSTFAIPGARVNGLISQARTAGEFHDTARAALVLIGANDVCRAREDQMISPEEFAEQLGAGLEQIRLELKDTTIYVVSIPNVYTLWQVLHDADEIAALWSRQGTCQAMLANPQSQAAADRARRLRVLAREVQYNAAIEKVCAAFDNCVTDNSAVFSTRFSREEVSSIDWFHPSVEGQTLLAEVAWEAGPFGDG